MINIRLSKQNSEGVYDMVLTDGKFEMAYDGVAAAVAMTEYLLTFRKEAIASPVVDTGADPLAGVQWYDIIFQTDKSKAEKEIELKRAILSAPGIERITQWSWSQTSRTVTIVGAVKTLWGSFDISQEITPL
jgi:hypothetical protein